VPKKNEKGLGVDAAEAFAAAVEESVQSATNAVLDQQKAVWSSFRDIARTHLGGDHVNKTAQETAKLMLSSFLEFAGMEREMRKRFVDLQVSFADEQIDLLNEHQRASNAASKKKASKKKASKKKASKKKASKKKASKGKKRK
jgi:hypothetical protein